MRFLFILLLPLLLLAESLKVGDTITPLTLESQHEQKVTTLTSGMWIISWDKLSTKSVNHYFEQNQMPNNVNFIVDVSQVPSAIMSLFVLPNMRTYKHDILLGYDEAYNQTLPYQEDMITLLYLKDAKISNILYVKELSAKLFE